jgi:phosphate acyltransferase
VRLLRRAPGGRGERLLGGPVATVAVDALGADRGLAEVVAAAADATAARTRCILFGPAGEIRTALGETGAGVEVVDAPEEISNDDEPAQAARSRQDASIVRAARALGEGTVDALVTTGPTGAALAASLIHVKRLPGVYRPALAVVVPVPGRRLLFLDVGANVEVRPEHLTQFAFMGAAFSQGVLGVSRPRVGLLSIGEEAGKGTEDVVAAHSALSALSSAPFDFTGNVEGFDLARGEVDVVVTDGFTGNVALKTLEATAKTVVGAIREAIRSGTVSKLGGLLVRHKLTPLRDSFSQEAVGGAYLLGLRGLVVVCHGNSSRRAIANAIGLAERGVEEEVVRRTADSLAAAGVLRGRGADRTGHPKGADPSSVPADSVTSH